MWILAVSVARAKGSLQYGISFICIEKAKSNLLREIPDWDFGKVKENGMRFGQEIESIKVKGGTEAQKRSSIRLSSVPMRDVVIMIGPLYSAFDNKSSLRHPFLRGIWIWDTYIALEQLHMILNPEREVDRSTHTSKCTGKVGIPPFAWLRGLGRNDRKFAALGCRRMVQGLETSI
jgi:putative alpha-1,2-mannosidase